MAFVLPLVVVALLYLPPVQDVAKHAAVRYAASQYGMEVSVGRFRLGFPLDLRLEEVYVGEQPGDTLAYLGALCVRVGLGGLWRKQFSVKEFGVERLRFVWGNAGEGLVLDAGVDGLELEVPEVDWGKRRVRVGQMKLRGGAVRMEVENEVEQGEGQEPSEGTDWTIAVKDMVLERVTYRMKAPALSDLDVGVGKARLTDSEVSIGKQMVGVDSVWVAGAWCHMLSGGAESVETDMATQLPWTVRVGSVGLENSSFRMGRGKEVLVLSGIGVWVDEVYNRGSVVRAWLRDVHAVQPGGLALTGMQGTVVLDSSETAFRGGILHTRNSRLKLEVQADAALPDIPGRYPLNMLLSGHVGMEDVRVFYPGLPEALRGKRMGMDVSAVWSGERLQLGQLVLDVPDHLHVTGSGSVSALGQWEKMRGELVVQGTLPDVSFAGAWLPGVEIPRGMEVLAKVGMEGGEYRTDVRLCCAEGCLTLGGFYRRMTEVFDGELLLSRFPLHRFLPDDSLGSVSADVRFTGKGFAPATMRAEVRAAVHELEYRGYAYRDVALAASLRRMQLRGTLMSEDEALPMGLVFKGDSVDSTYVLALRGHVGMVDLHRLHLVSEPLQAGSGIRLEAALGPGQTGRLQVELDSARMADGSRDYALGDLRMELGTTPQRTSLEVHSGDLRMRFRADTSLPAFASRMGGVAEVIGMQAEERDVDMEAVAREVPPFSLEIAGAEQNAVARLLRSWNIGFKDLSFSVASRRKGGLRVGGTLQGLYAGTLRIDSVRMGAWQAGKNLIYSLYTYSAAEAWKGLFNLGVNGRMQGKHFRAELKQQNAEGRVGFDLGVRAELGDTSLTVGLFPVNPVLGYSRWTVNEDNWVTVDRRKRIRADLHLAYGDKVVRLQSVPDEGDRRECLRMEVAGIDLARLSEMAPMMPDLGGVLGMDLLMYSSGRRLGAEGNMAVADMAVDGKRLGSLAADLSYRVDPRFEEHAVRLGMSVDGVRQVEVHGEVATGRPERTLSLDADIPSLSLETANVFLPSEVMQLQGVLTGGVRLRGTLDAPQIDGSLAFRGGKAEIGLIGSVFSLDTVPVRIAAGRMLFDAFRFMAPNRSGLVLDGEIRLTPFDRMGMDLTVDARNFEVVNVRKNPTSMIYGKAYADAHVGLSGPFSDLDVTGNVHLLNTTDITYVLRSSDPTLVDKSVDLVRFVSFRDTTGQTGKPLGRMDAGGFAMRLQVEIGEMVHAGVDLSEDGGNRVDIRGGGNLVLAMSPENGMTLSGKYILSDGTVEYGVPIVGKKAFRINSGSFVEWTGAVMNPALNISAAEQVKADVEEGDRTRQVLFESIIRIRNNLARPDITFDLSAPNDMVIQNQLATFSPEERTRQALNLLIYNTYTAPGAASASANTNMANNAIYSFVENELNKYTRKAGLTVGFDAHGTEDNIARTDVTYQFSRQLFNDRVRVKIGGRISTDGNEENGGSLKNNLVDDISIEYTMTRRRNLFAKVFRHSNYESVLDGQVVRTGVGVVWRKNFRKFKDMFKNKNREERLNRKMTNP